VRIKTTKKNILLISLVLILLLSITACTLYPKYEWPTYDDELGEVLDIDGVVYRTLPETNWEPISNSSKVRKTGKLGSKNSSYGIFTYTSDVNRIFIYTENDSLFADVRHAKLYYRKDIDLPELNIQNVDEIYFKKWGTSSNSPYDSIVTDKQIIEDTINRISSGSQQLVTGGITLGFFDFVNNDYEGISIGFTARASQNKYWLITTSSPFANNRTCTEISQELLEKLVGEELPTAKEYLEQQQNSE